MLKEKKNQWLEMDSNLAFKKLQPNFNFITFHFNVRHFISVADPGSGIRNGFFLDPGSRIPDPNYIFLEAYQRWVKSSLIL